MSDLKSICNDDYENEGIQYGANKKNKSLTSVVGNVVGLNFF